MDKEICSDCKYYRKGVYEDVCMYPAMVEGKSYYSLISGIKMCRLKQTIQLPSLYGHYEVNYILGDDKMKNDNFKTYLRSEDERKDKILSYVEISCKNYDTFKQIVEAVMPILEKEDVKKECD